MVVPSMAQPLNRESPLVPGIPGDVPSSRLMAGIGAIGACRRSPMRPAAGHWASRCLPRPNGRSQRARGCGTADHGRGRLPAPDAMNRDKAVASDRRSALSVSPGLQVPTKPSPSAAGSASCETSPTTCARMGGAAVDHSAGARSPAPCTYRCVHICTYICREDLQSGGMLMAPERRVPAMDDCRPTRRRARPVPGPGLSPGPAMPRLEEEVHSQIQIQ